MERPRRPAEVGRSGREPGGGPEGGPVGRAEEEAGWASASFRQEKGTSAGSHGPQQGPRPPSDRQTEERTGLIRKHFGGSVFSRTSFLKNIILLLQNKKIHFWHLTSKQNQIPKSNFMLKEEERDSFGGRERHKRTSLFCKREAAVVRRLLTATTTTVGAAMAVAAAAAAAYHCGGSICPDLIPGRSVAVINRPEGRKLLKVGK